MAEIMEKIWAQEGKEFYRMAYSIELNLVKLTRCNKNYYNSVKLISDKWNEYLYLYL